MECLAELLRALAVCLSPRWVEELRLAPYLIPITFLCASRRFFEPRAPRPLLATESPPLKSCDDVMYGWTTTSTALMLGRRRSLSDRLLLDEVPAIQRLIVQVEAAHSAGVPVCRHLRADEDAVKVRLDITDAQKIFGGDWREGSFTKICEFSPLTSEGSLPSCGQECGGRRVVAFAKYD